MTKLVLGEVVTDEAYERWVKMSNVDKLSLVHANQARLAEKAAEAKRASLPSKPANWDRLSQSDRRTWYHQNG